VKGETHESFDHPPDAAPGSPRSFGLVFAGVFCVIAIWPVLHGEAFRLWALAIAIAFAAVAAARPALLSGLNRLWFRFGLALQRVVTPVIMTLVFVVGVVPTAFAMRLFGKDPLKLKRDPGAPTYWIKRQTDGPPSSMRNQF
jgi:hypothetical protein